MEQQPLALKQVKCLLSGCRNMVARTGPCPQCRQLLCVETEEEALERVMRGQPCIVWRDSLSDAELDELQAHVDEADERARQLSEWKRRYGLKPW